MSNTPNRTDPLAMATGVSNDTAVWQAPKVRRLKATKKEKAFAVTAIALAICGRFLPEPSRPAYAIALSLVVMIVWTVWITRYVRNCLKNEMSISAQAPRSIAPVTYLLTPFAIIVAGMSLFSWTEKDQGVVLPQVLLGVSVLMSCSFTYFLNPLLEHLKRPFDSIESRAERDAASLCFLVTLLLIGALGFALPAFKIETEGSVYIRAVLCVLVVFLTGIYYGLRQLFIWKRS